MAQREVIAGFGLLFVLLASGSKVQRVVQILSKEVIVKQTVMLIAEPSRVNRILAELAEVGIEVRSVAPIQIEVGFPMQRQDVMVVYNVEHESEDASFAHLAWMEETLGEFCKIY